MPLSTFLLPAPPLSHGLTTTTFVAPPLDGSITVPQMFDHHAMYSSNHPVFLYEDSPGNKIFIHWKEIHQATGRVARYIEAQGIGAATEGPKIIAILAVLDSITYFTLVHGIMRLGHVPFPISPRNSPVAIAHLLTGTHASYILVSGGPSMQGLWAGAAEVLQGGSRHPVNALPTPFYSDLYENRLDENVLPTPSTYKAHLSGVGMILHTSGSTSFPKPIPILHRNLIEWTRLPCYGEVDLCSATFGITALPMFHALGSHISLAMVACGATLLVFKPEEHPSLPTPERVIGSITGISVDVLISIPSFLEAWSMNPEWVEVLKQCRAVLYGGAPLSKVVGNALAAAGVRLSQVYGSTEMGTLTTFIPTEIRPELWEYFHLSKLMKASWAPHPGSDSVVLTVLSCPSHSPSLLNANIEGEMGFMANDLLLEHQTRKGWYLFVGRVDDQIVLSNGEKTNPGPLEAIISKDPLIAGSVIFGSGRPHNGAIIAPAASVVLDMKDKEQVAVYVDAIWPSIQLANEYAPSHSRLFKEMLIIARPDKPFTFTGKGSVRRSAAVVDYQEEIEATYQAMEYAPSADLEIPSDWTKENTLHFVRELVSTIMQAKISDDADIFQNGADSIQAIFMRNAIIRAIRRPSIEVGSIPATLIYQYPTISLLSESVYALVNPSSKAIPDSSALEIEELKELVDKYGSDFQQHQSTAVQSKESQEVVVVTGTTGALGSAVLAKLAAIPTVGKIYALNRSSHGKDLRARQEESLLERGYDPRVVFRKANVELIQIDLSASDLGMDRTAYETMRETVTTIIHIAWRVDFNLSISSFEPHLLSLRNLINLALGSPQFAPPKLIFTSSVAVLNQLNLDGPAEEKHFEDPKTVVNANGYGKSKWVAEQILDRAAKKTGLKPVVVRIGQLSGGKSGVWNTSEWVPAIIRSGEIVGALPSDNDTISWLPIEVAATALTDFRDIDSPIVHLSHPYPTKWNDIMKPIANALQVPLVPYSEWLDRLEADLEDPSHAGMDALAANPALRLMDMFRALNNDSAPSNGRDAMGTPKLSNTLAIQSSPSLARNSLTPLTEEDALGWLAYWRKKGFLKTPEIAKIVSPTPVTSISNGLITEMDMGTIFSEIEAR